MTTPPHLFHTSNDRVVEWLSQFTGWLPYEHQVVALLDDGRKVPLPVNLDTINAVFGIRLETADDAMSYLASVALPRSPVISAEDHLYSTIGKELTDLFFRPYTKKMWQLDLSEMDAAVVRRLQIRTDRDPRYFLSDTFQALPTDGYTRAFERILDHDRISVRLITSFSQDDMAGYDACFNSMPIDEFYEFDLGELPYRSIRFHVSDHLAATAEGHATINYTDAGPYTRETWWHALPGHRVHETSNVLRTIEEPCCYRDNNFERYYPIKDRGLMYQGLYERYAARAAVDDQMFFIGRCGTYQYLDMHQVINQSLVHVSKWIARA